MFGGGGANTTGNSIFGGTQNAAPFGTAKVQPMFGAMQPQSTDSFLILLHYHPELK